MNEYIIQPVLMGGTIKEFFEDKIKIHLKGRLGVLTLPMSFFKGDTNIKAEDKVSFYFSYIQVVEKAGNYDISGINIYSDIEPELFGGKISLVNDTAVEVSIDSVGTIFVPRRWVFSDTELKEGQNVEFYLSGIKKLNDLGGKQ